MARKSRGGTRALPLQYFGETAATSASEGVDRLTVSGNTVRPSIGGKRRTKRDIKRSNTKKKNGTKRRYRGGFYPSVMGNFVAGASKYIVPLALYAGFKLLNRPTHKKGRSRRTTRK